MMLTKNLIKNLSTFLIITIKSKKKFHDVDPIIQTEPNQEKSIHNAFLND